MIDINNTYKTVLYILNKEQTGHITPEEFNSFAEQAQLEIFEDYLFLLGVNNNKPKTSVEFADDLDITEQKLQVFKKQINIQVDTVTGLTNIKSQTGVGLTTSADSTGADYVHYIDSVEYISDTGDAVLLEKVSPVQFNRMNRSKLLKPTIEYPVYILSNKTIEVSPILNPITINGLVKPTAPSWGYSLNSLGIPVYTPNSNTTHFELHDSEQVKIVSKILSYAGIVIKDQSILEAANTHSGGLSQKETI